MTIDERLRAIVGPMPAGSAVTLPVEVLRAWLNDSLSPPELRPPAVEPVADLTVCQVATALRRKVSTVRGWCALGQLEAYKLNGREWRIRRAALRAYQDRQADAGPPRLRLLRELDKPDLGAWRLA